MSTLVICDNCGQPINEVVYELRALDAKRIDVSPIISNAHLHWECIPAFGRSTVKAEANLMRTPPSRAAGGGSHG